MVRSRPDDFGCFVREVIDALRYLARDDSFSRYAIAWSTAGDGLDARTRPLGPAVDMPVAAPSPAR